MNLQELPIHILINIFKYVPERVKYSVLCKSFYHAICLIPNDERLIRIDDCDRNINSKIDFLRTTNRKLTKFYIGIDEGKFLPGLLEVMKHQGKHIKQLKIMATMTQDVFWQLIAAAKNCRKLTFIRLNVVDIKKDMDDELPANFASPGKPAGKVEILKFDLTSNKEFYVPVILNKLISLQPNLRQLSLDCDSLKNIEPEYFENFLTNCKLECLEWKLCKSYDDVDFGQIEDNYEEQREVVTEIISGQTKLKTLKAKFIIWKELFEEITSNCQELEKFEFYGAQEISPEIFLTIQNLKKLKSLSFGKMEEWSSNVFEGNYTKLSNFLIGIRELNLTSLSVFRIKETSPDIFIELAALVPSLKSLTIEIVFDMFENSRHPCYILQQFANLEEFSIDMYCDAETMQRMYNLEVNLYLKSLKFSTNKIVLTVNDIRNILKACPNLEYFFIDIFMQDSVNLEEVTLEELDGILECGKKLRTVYIVDLKISDPENIKDCQLKSKFQAFEYSSEEIHDCVSNTFYEMILSSDKADVRKIMEQEKISKVLRKVYNQL